mgnify:FL=1
MHIQDVDVGSLIPQRKILSNKEKLSILLDTVTPQEELKDAVKGKIPKHFKRNSIREREGFEKELEYYKLGFTTALSEFNIELWWSQAVQFGAFLSGKYKTGYCVATPRYGKSFLCGIMSNHFAYEGENCYAVGSTQEYSGIIIQHAREILVKSHPEVKEMLTFGDSDISSVDKRLKRGLSSFSSEGFSFRNGGKLEGLSAGSNFTDPSKIHVIGRGGNMFGDEASDISPIALGHMGRREFESDDGRKLIMYLISNPRSLNNFFDFMTKEDLADDEFVMWLDVVTAIEEGSIKYTKEELMRSQFTITEDSIRENLLCEFPTERSNFFEASPDILDSFDANGKNLDYFIGVDSAYKGSDSIQVTVSVVDESNHATVLDTKDIKPKEWIDGITAIDIVNKIVTLANRLNAKGIAIDAGGGAHIVQPLKMRRLSGQLKCPVYDINFGGKATEIKKLAKEPSAEYAFNRRAEMHLMLRGMMEAQRVSFVRKVWDLISREMAFVSEIQKPEDRLVKIRPKSEIKKLLQRSPDELDSVILSLHCAELYYLGGN